MDPLYPQGGGNGSRPFHFYGLRSGQASAVPDAASTL